MAKSIEIRFFLFVAFFTFVFLPAQGLQMKLGNFNGNAKSHDDMKPDVLKQWLKDGTITGLKLNVETSTIICYVVHMNRYEEVMKSDSKMRMDLDGEVSKIGYANAEEKDRLTLPNSAYQVFCLGLTDNDGPIDTDLVVQFIKYVLKSEKEFAIKMIVHGANLISDDFSRYDYVEQGNVCNGKLMGRLSDLKVEVKKETNKGKEKCSEEIKTEKPKTRLDRAWDHTKEVGGILLQKDLDNTHRVTRGTIAVAKAAYNFCGDRTHDLADTVKDKYRSCRGHIRSKASKTPETSEMPEDPEDPEIQ